MHASVRREDRSAVAMAPITQVSLRAWVVLASVQAQVQIDTYRSVRTYNARVKFAYGPVLV